MENKLKEYIDKLFRKRLKEKSEKEYNYSSWLNKVLSLDLKCGYFPKNRDEEDVFQLLTLEVLYKLTLKSACDKGLPIIEELLEDLGIDKDFISNYIEKVKSFNSESLEFYLLFKEELESTTDLCMDAVFNTIDKLSEDSKYGVVVSHPAKMTNPECKFPKLVATAAPSSDGFIRTGNSKVVFDMHINAVNLKFFKFVSLLYKQKPLLEHIKNENNMVFEQLFGVSEDKAKKWVKNFSACLNNEDTRTNQYIKQTYYPVKNNYHLLSFLTPSGLVFSLKDKIDAINRSPNAYSGKKLEKDNKYFENGFSSIPNLTMTRQGGDHPKNISGLNNKYQSYYLLSSSPPTLEKRDIRFPKQDFFQESLRYYDYRDIFYALHRIFKTNYNNIHIREGRDYRLQNLMDRIVDKMWAVRAVSKEQYYPDNSGLNAHQKIWLCDECKQIREEENDWLDKLCKEIASWTIRTYEKLLGKQAFKLDEDVRKKIHKVAVENKEALR